MYVSNGSLKIGDGYLSKGEPIPREVFTSWPARVTTKYLATGRILDVTEDEAKKMRAEAAKEDEQRKLAATNKALREYEATVERLHGEIAQAKKRLADLDKELGIAEGIVKDLKKDGGESKPKPKESKPSKAAKTTGKD